MNLSQGDLVEIVWLDSGLKLDHASEDDARRAKLHTVTYWGRVVYADDEQVCLAQEVNEDGQGQYGIVQTACIQRVRVLSPGEDWDAIVSDIIEEVESAELPPLSSRKPTDRLTTRSDVIAFDLGDNHEGSCWPSDGVCL